MNFATKRSKEMRQQLEKEVGSRLRLFLIGRNNSIIMRSRGGGDFESGSNVAQDYRKRFKRQKKESSSVQRVQLAIIRYLFKFTLSFSIHVLISFICQAFMYVYYLISSTVLIGRYYYPYFTDVVTVVQDISPKVTWLNQNLQDSHMYELQPLLL